MEEALESSDISEDEMDSQIQLQLNRMEEAAQKMRKQKKNKFFSNVLAGKFYFNKFPFKYCPSLQLTIMVIFHINLSSLLLSMIQLSES